uniref:Serpin B3-like n=1 Tax=Monodon monoceros TaxID=40151 RepID=A0A8C6AUX7_MONMO
MSSLGEGITHFAVDLFQQIRQSKKENIFYSPLSIMSAFAMTSLGARGHTASEIQKVGRSFLYTYQLVLVLCWLLCRWSQTWLSPGVAQEAANLPRTGRLNVANRLYAEKTILFLQVSFVVMKQTNLFNCMSPEDMQVKILEIPYKGQELSMFLLLPNDVDGLQQLEDQLTAEKLIEWTSPQNMNQREIELHLPQFKVEETYDLKPMLRALGMVDAFTEGKADFSGMSKVRELKVSEAFHKSFVEVNEEGTEATAVTGVEAVIRSAVFPESFHCDHPFLFLIKHNKINSLLFYGRVSSPEM